MTSGRTREVAVVGSPSSNTELTLDLLLEATEERLVGALTAFEAVQDGASITSVGQIVGVELKNRWHEDSVFRNLVKRTGEVPPITNRQDTRTANLVVGATFRKSTKEDGYDPDVLGMVPSTGTRVYRVEQGLLDELLEVYNEEIIYLGQAYANDVLYPMWLKHFGSGARGAGEAYHLGVFGKTGSGKSGLAKMMLCAYSKHPEMSILVIDPQGEFSLELDGNRVGRQRLPVSEIVGQNRPIRVYRIDDLRLDDWDTFEELLQSLPFFERLGIPIQSQDNSRRAAEVIRRALQAHCKLTDLGTKHSLQNGLRAVAESRNAELVYSTRARARQLIDRVNQLLQDEQELEDVFDNYWEPICSLFGSGQGRPRLFTYSKNEQPGIVNMLLGLDQSDNARPVIVIDISRQGNQRFWSEELQRRILTKLLEILVYRATASLSTDESSNVLVLLDEAHRHAPSGTLERGSEADRLRSLLRRAVLETRKYGIGWFFISQTLGGFDSFIIDQLRIEAFGFGLAMGTEFDRLRSHVGGDRRALELYQSFRDPQSFPRQDLQEFPFMAIGPVSPLAFSGKPLFFTAFTDSDEFIASNDLWQAKPLSFWT